MTPIVQLALEVAAAIFLLVVGFVAAIIVGGWLLDLIDAIWKLTTPRKKGPPPSSSYSVPRP